MACTVMLSPEGMRCQDRASEAPAKEFFNRLNRLLRQHDSVTFRNGWYRIFFPGRGRRLEMPAGSQRTRVMSRSMIETRICFVPIRPKTKHGVK